MKFVLKIAQKDIKKAQEQVLNENAKNTQIKGFRKGKAPVAMVAESLGKKKVLEMTLDRILPVSYSKEVKSKKLHPITMPKILPKTMEEGKDWEFDVEIAQKPEVKLGEYKKHVKSALKKAVASKKTKETKKKGDEKSPEPKTSEDDLKMKAVFDILLEKITFTISPLLIEEEVNNQLNRLASQIQKLGLSVEDYLKSMKTDIEKLKKDYEKTAQENLKLEFILHEIGQDLSLKAGKEDVDKLIASVGDESVKQRILNSPQELASIEHSLTKQKVVDALLKGNL